MAEMLLDLAALEPPTLIQSLLVVAVPSVLMLLGSAVAFFERVPSAIQAGTQNFSAGLLISAVAGELYPLMNGETTPVGVTQVQPPSDFASTCAICIGFALGLLFMFGIETLMDGDDEEDEAEATKDRKVSDASALEEPMLSPTESVKALALVDTDAQKMEDVLEHLKTQLPKGERDTIDQLVHIIEGHIDAAKRHLINKPPLDQHNIMRMGVHADELSQNIKALRSCTDVAEARPALRDVEKTLHHIHKHAERVRFKRWESKAFPPSDLDLKEQIEWTLVFTVCVDAAVDGLLIGLAFAASEGAGWAMSMATSIEMCFLGLSFSATIQNATRSKVKHVALVMIPPLLLASFGIGGHFLGDALETSPLVFTCFISFAVVALLFLVTQELLTEAREVAGESKLLNSMFFVGLLGGVILSKYLG